MNSIAFDTTAHSVIDAKDSLSPIPVIKLKGALKKEPENAVLAVMATDPGVERDIQDFCKSTGNMYLGSDQMDGHDLYYVKKQTPVCQACSKTRIVVGGLAAIGALIYSAPQVMVGDPSALVTFVFLAALASLPPLAVNNVRLLGELIANAKD